VRQELESEQDCVEWARIPSDEVYDESLLGIISQNTDFYVTFADSIKNIRALLNQDVGVRLNQILHRLLFVNVITTLEAYLSDAFMNTIFSNPQTLRKFVETNRDFSKRNLPLTQIYSRVDQLSGEVKEYLLGLRYHNLAKIQKMYKATLDVDFLDGADLYKAIAVRHDLVHRNGKRTDGSETSLTKDKVLKLVDQVETFIKHINDQV
jgi:hypothetical protein